MKTGAGDGMPPIDIKMERQRELLLDYRAEYDLLIALWKSLEDKAQGMVAVAGLFVGAMYAFVQAFGVSSPTLERIGVALVVLGLVSAVVAAVSVLRVRRVKEPPMGRFLGKMVSEVLAGAPIDELPERDRRMLYERCTLWHEVNDSIASGNNRKARWLRVSHALLVSSIALLAVLTCLLAWTRSGGPQ